MIRYIFKKKLKQKKSHRGKQAVDIGYDVHENFDKEREYSDRIAKDPFETTHADNTRNSADILANALLNMQQAH